ITRRSAARADIAAAGKPHPSAALCAWWNAHFHRIRRIATAFASTGRANVASLAGPATGAASELETHGAGKLRDLPRSLTFRTHATGAGSRAQSAAFAAGTRRITLH